MKEKTNLTVNYFFNSEFSGSDEEKSSDDRESKRLSNFNVPDYDELIRM